MRVLVADDDALIRALLGELVTILGHDCIAVDDGDAAWQRLVSEGAEVVISDWHMPGMNGVELCRRVRAHPEIAYPYFILLTGRDDRHDILTAVRAGVDDHLTKPVDLDDLEARLIVAERVRGLHLELTEARGALAAASAALAARSGVDDDQPVTEQPAIAELEDPGGAVRLGQALGG